MLGQLITGHNFMNRHEAICDPTGSTSAECRLCMEGEDESSFHVVAECPALANLRRQTIGRGIPFLSSPFEWDPVSLTGFLREADIVSMMASTGAE